MSPTGRTDPRPNPGHLPPQDLSPHDAASPTEPSRRLFVAGVGAGALAAGTASFGGFSLPGTGGSERTADAVTTAGDQPGFVVYVRPGESELTLMSGDREVVVDDPALARALTRKLGS